VATLRVTRQAMRDVIQATRRAAEKMI